MSENLLTIQAAAKISGKSIQTIRRALKTHKLEAKRKKTPQGFNYLIVKESLMDFYKITPTLFDRPQGSLQQNSASQQHSGTESGSFSMPSSSTSTELSSEFATVEDLKKFQNTIENLLNEHKKEKENFMRLMKAFQDKFVVMESQLKLLEEPKKKWYKFW